MKTKARSKKRNILIGILAVCLVIALTVGTSLAYLTDTKTQTNVFTVGDVDISLTGDTVDCDNLVPGSIVAFNPQVTVNSGKAYVRLKVEYLDKTTGSAITDTSRINLIEKTFRSVSGAFSSDLIDQYNNAGGIGSVLGFYNSVIDARNEAQLSYHKDTTGANTSYLYASGDAALTATPDDNIPPLFDCICVPKDWDSAKMSALGSFKIKVTAQAIQTFGVDSDIPSVISALNTAFSGS